MSGPEDEFVADVVDHTPSDSSFEFVVFYEEDEEDDDE